MTQTAIMSDIHGNLDALEAVLADVDRQKVDRLYCLGDIVGYGANPSECVQLIRERRIPCVMGNHDLAVADEEAAKRMRFHGAARRAVEWTRAQLSAEQKEYLASLPYTMDFRDGLTLVHGSLNEPDDFNYVDADRTAVESHLWETFLEFADRGRKYCFVGHSHLPLLYGFVGYQEERVKPDVPDRRKKPAQVRIKVSGYERIVVSVGAVGQPRDDDPRACYVIFDGRQVTFRRVPYHALRAASRIFAIKELDNRLGDRLLIGG